MSDTAAPFGLRPIGRLDSGGLQVSRQYPMASDRDWETYS